MDVAVINTLWKETTRIWKERSKFAHSNKSLSMKEEILNTKGKIQKDYTQGLEEAKGKDTRWWKIKLGKSLKPNVESQKLWLKSVKIVRGK